MSELNAVVDLSHFNTNVNFQQTKDAGILGVIHKATEGTGYVDPMYETHKQEAEAVGMMWGAYHFGTGSDPVAQASHFLDTVKPDPTTLLVLDFEPNSGGTTMTLDQAVTFVQEVNNKTGKWPGFYSGSLIKELLGNNTNPVLQNCWFWLAEYGSVAKVPANWPTWTMWQYTDGNFGPEPHSVPGIGNCDRDKFNGSADRLKALWGYEQIA